MGVGDTGQWESKATGGEAKDPVSSPGASTTIRETLGKSFHFLSAFIGSFSKYFWSTNSADRALNKTDRSPALPLYFLCKRAAFLPCEHPGAPTRIGLNDVEGSTSSEWRGLLHMQVGVCTGRRHDSRRVAGGPWLVPLQRMRQCRAHQAGLPGFRPRMQRVRGVHWLPVFLTFEAEPSELLS